MQFLQLVISGISQGCIYGLIALGFVLIYKASEAKEAMAMAMIANDSVVGLVTNVAGATGGRPTVLGKICL